MAAASTSLTLEEKFQVLDQCLQRADHNRALELLRELANDVEKFDMTKQIEIMNQANRLSMIDKEAAGLFHAMKTRLRLEHEMEEKVFPTDEKKELPRENPPSRKREFAAVGEETEASRKKGVASGNTETVPDPTEEDDEIDELYKRRNDIRQQLRLAQSKVALGKTANYAGVLRALNALIKFFRNSTLKGHRVVEYNKVFDFIFDLQTHPDIGVKNKAKEAETIFLQKHYPSQLSQPRNNVVRDLALKLITTALGPPPNGPFLVRTRGELVNEIEDEIFKSASIGLPFGQENPDNEYLVVFYPQQKETWKRYRDLYTAVIANLEDPENPDLNIKLYTDQIKPATLVNGDHDSLSTNWDAEENANLKALRRQKYEIEFKKRRIRTLNDEDMALVESLFNVTPNLEIASIGGVKILGADMRSLKPGSRLTKNVVDGYLAMLEKRALDRWEDETQRKRFNPPRVRIFDSAFLRKLLPFDREKQERVYKYEAVQNAPEYKIDSNVDFLIVPMLRKNNFWTCVVVDYRGKYIVYYPGREEDEQDLYFYVRKFIFDDSTSRGIITTAEEGAKWSLFNKPPCPNLGTAFEIESAVFLLTVVDFLTAGVSLLFDETDMDRIRKRIALELNEESLF